ncbi:MAG: putative iron-siderophore transporter, substrate-binding protein [Modestobacter sp.]|nr:putative iron-siderophore transporter, substrate-binding protein [Modestobacter sp.]
MITLCSGGVQPVGVSDWLAFVDAVAAHPGFDGTEVAVAACTAEGHAVLLDDETLTGAFCIGTPQGTRHALENAVPLFADTR